MKRRWLRTLPPLLLALSLGAASAAANPLIAPPDSSLAAEAAERIERKRLGVTALWGGLLLSSVIITVVRMRKRRSAR